MIHDIRDKFQNATYGFEGVQINVRKDPEASRLLAEVTAVGSVDFPGDTLENMIAQGVNWFKGMGKSQAGSGKSKKSSGKGG